MATNLDYIEFVIDQIQGNKALRFRKMFGDYMVYANDKPILLVCDNTVYVKKLMELEQIMKSSECGIPYDGAKEHYILDIENKDLVNQVVDILEKITPLPKSRVKRK